jgi:putative ABC transport system substrate-binding protein
MKRRDFITLLGSAAVAWPLAARAQQAGKVYRIGYLSPASLSSELFALQSGAIRDLGWIEGKNVEFERRYADTLDLLPELAAELVRLNVDIIMAPGTLAPLALKRATSTIPIVMTAAGDPLTESTHHFSLWRVILVSTLGSVQGSQPPLRTAR